MLQCLNPIANRTFKAATFAVLYGAFVSSPATALTLDTTQALFFGTIVMLDVNTQSIITVNSADTGYSVNANTYVVDAPARGEYTITDADPSSAYTITFPASGTLIGPGGSWTVDTFTTSPGSLITDGAGEDTFFIGATATSLGNGTAYPDGNYTDSIDITFNF